MARILVSAMGFEGHVAAVLGLVRELSDRGHRVRVYTGSAFAGPVSAAGGELVNMLGEPANRRTGEPANRRTGEPANRRTGRRGAAF